MTEHSSRSSQILKWFRSSARPILQKTSPLSVIEELDKLASQIEELERIRGKLFPICLVGQAGVGKSTLINTLIADTEIVVPSGGGTGPLTANALRVVYGERPSLVVQYHSKKQINETRFILESEVLRQTRAEARLANARADEDSVIKAIELDSEEDKKTRTEEAIGRARLLVAGAQSAQREMTYLADALRIAMKQPTKSTTEIIEEDMERLRHVQEALQHGTNATARSFDSANNPNFGHRLRDHACGFLAPLIQEMTIHWPSPLLRDSLELVDLPGIGILSDVYASITSEYLRNRARAVMLVVDSRGNPPKRC